MHAELVLHQVPIWLTRDPAVYLLSLSALSVSQLTDAAHSLHASHLRRKNDYIQAILDDFLHQCVHFWGDVPYCDQRWTLFISQHFSSHYVT
jgi:hypothetical protein